MQTIDWLGASVCYETPNRVSKWRVDTLFTKEPDTIEWLDGMGADDVLLDVGANVGMYSILAAKALAVKVYAFEPESQNFALLNRNIKRNQLDGLVTAYAIAISDKEGFGPLYLNRFEIGESCHNFGEKLDFKHNALKPVFTQGCFATTIDRLVSLNVIPVPTHIKIDVDGIEHLVVSGGFETISNKGVETILIEINTNLQVHREIINRICDAGYSYTDTGIRKSGTFEGVGNHIFRR